MLRRLATVLMLPIFAGCSGYAIRIDTVPDGATIAWQGSGAQEPDSAFAVYRPRPFTVYLPKPETGDVIDGCYVIKGLMATWESGAESRSDPVMRLCDGPTTYYLRLERPEDEPGLESDLEVQERLWAARAKHRAEEEEALREEAAEAAKGTVELLGKVGEGMEKGLETLAEALEGLESR